MTQIMVTKVAHIGSFKNLIAEGMALCEPFAEVISALGDPMEYQTEQILFGHIVGTFFALGKDVDTTHEELVSGLPPVNAGVLHFVECRVTRDITVCVTQFDNYAYRLGFLLWGTRNEIANMEQVKGWETIRMATLA